MGARSQTFNRVGRVQLSAMAAWKGYMGEHISFALIHEFSERLQADAQLAGDVPLICALVLFSV